MINSEDIIITSYIIWQIQNGGNKSNHVWNLKLDAKP